MTSFILIFEMFTSHKCASAHIVIIVFSLIEII